LEFLTTRSNSSNCEQAHVFQEIVRGVSALGNLLLINQRAIKPRRLSCRQDNLSDAQSLRISALQFRGEIRNPQRRQWHVAAELSQPDFLFPGCFLDSYARERRQRLSNWSKVLVDPFINLFLLEITHDYQDRVVRPVERVMKRANICE